MAGTTGNHGCRWGTYVATHATGGSGAAGPTARSRFGERLIRVRAEGLDRLFRPIPSGEGPLRHRTHRAS